MRNVYTVGQVNSYIKHMFEEDFLLQDLRVKGEVSNCKYHSSGHIYFTLKDVKGTISCIMFAGNRSGLSFQLSEGMQVIVTGTVDVYERDGKYQVYARKIEPDGEGALFEQFQRLKKELQERGMFAAEYKKPIPRYIRTLGVVTASTGAAIRDIIHITQRRNPYVQIILYPAIVQGEMAAESIVRGIKSLERKQVDVMIVGRGGGSMEDLWAFNEEIVAQAVFDCSVPIISAVGHETDTTMIDYVSDLRAPTPSAAAELAVYDYETVEKSLRMIQSRLENRMQQHLSLSRARMQNLGTLLRSNSPIGKIREKKTYALQLEEHLQAAMQTLLQKKHQQLAIYIERLKGLSPLEKLNQGYAYVSDENGNTVKDICRVKIGEAVTIYIRNGRMNATITGKMPMEHGMEEHHEEGK